MTGITQWFLRTWFGKTYIECDTACAALERAGSNYLAGQADVPSELLGDQRLVPGCSGTGA